MFVRVANKRRANIWVQKDGQRVNGKSILGLMTLAAAHHISHKLRIILGVSNDSAVSFHPPNDIPQAIRRVRYRNATMGSRLVG